MAPLIAQLDLLAQGLDIDQWGDILVIVVMAVLWLGGTLAKALTARKGSAQSRQQKEQAAAKGQGGRRETWQERLTRKVQEIQQAAQQAQARQSKPQTRPRSSAQAPQPPTGKITIRRGTQGDSVMVYERPAPSPIRETAYDAVPVNRKTTGPGPVEPEVALPVERSLQPVASDSARKAASRPDTQSESFPHEEIFDTADSDALRKAILHYEILGKPMALRSPSEEASTF
ncbi:MAG: hypothetical protein KBE65_20470 [Phycisphaerae bacterium]|nr:hypothetical protein [Phycisphaerae bacterium]